MAHMMGLAPSEALPGLSNPPPTPCPEWPGVLSTTPAFRNQLPALIQGHTGTWQGFYISARSSGTQPCSFSLHFWALCPRPQGPVSPRPPLFSSSSPCKNFQLWKKGSEREPGVALGSHSDSPATLGSPSPPEGTGKQPVAQVPGWGRGRAGGRRRWTTGRTPPASALLALWFLTQVDGPRDRRGLLQGGGWCQQHLEIPSTPASGEVTPGDLRQGARKAPSPPDHPCGHSHARGAAHQGPSPGQVGPDQASLGPRCRSRHLTVPEGVDWALTQHGC